MEDKQTQEKSAAEQKDTCTEKRCKVVYGIDITKTITPVMVRDAIIECFIQAHKEVLDTLEDTGVEMLPEEMEEMKKLNVEFLIKRMFDEIGADFEKPTKKDLVGVCKKLAEYAKKFRKPDIVEKHYCEVCTLLDKLEE